MTAYVYGLKADPESPVKYIGKSVQPTVRLADHLSSRAAKRVRAWMDTLPCEPTLVILEKCDSESEALLAEKKWIAHYRADGYELLNRATARPESPRLPQWTGFGSRVRLMREKRGLSATVLARRCGIWRPNLSRIEHGLTPNVSAETALLLARALGTTVEFLVTGEPASDERAA